MSRWLALFVLLAFAEAVATDGKPRNKPAGGPLSYLIGGDPAQGHDIDWFIGYDGKLWFFEKQTGDEVTLSPAEIASVFFEEAE